MGGLAALNKGKGTSTLHKQFNGVELSPAHQKMRHVKKREAFKLKADNWNRIYKQAEQVVTRNIFDEIILVPVRGKLGEMERIYSLDSVSEYIWTNLDGKKRLREILEGVNTAFEVEKQQAEQDIEEFINMLSKEGLVVEVNE